LHILLHPISIFCLKDWNWSSICLNRLPWLIDLLIEVFMTVKIEIVSTSWVSMFNLDCWCVQLLLIWSFLIVLVSEVKIWQISILSLKQIVYRFLLSYTLVFYKNLQSLFTDRVRNVVITKSPDRDMIVAGLFKQIDHP
jgi:hypothetical protein